MNAPAWGVTVCRWPAPHGAADGTNRWRGATRARTVRTTVPDPPREARDRRRSARDDRDEQLKEHIKRSRRDNYGVYGARKVWLGPCVRGLRVRG
jgi:hypothetical protein